MVQRHGAQPGEPVGRSRAQRGHALVDHARQPLRHRRVGPVVVVLRRRADDLDVDAAAVHDLQPRAEVGQQRDEALDLLLVDARGRLAEPAGLDLLRGARLRLLLGQAERRSDDRVGVDVDGGDSGHRENISRAAAYASGVSTLVSDRSPGSAAASASSPSSQAASSRRTRQRA